MQVGFVAAESGQGRAKNVRNILLKNTLNITLCALCWWAVGYAFAYGDSAGGFIGTSDFFTEGATSNNKPWFFSWTFALSTVTITSGCLAERTHLAAYPAYTAATSLLVHPLVAHWVWAPGGWLQDDVSDQCQFLDFAGGAVVHLVGGLMGLVGAFMCGPRLGRFAEGSARALPGHDVTSFSLGTFMLWFGWFGFNCGSAYVYLGGQPASSDVASEVVGRVALNMTLCASSAGLTALVVCSHQSGTFDLMVCCNGLLSGLSASTASAGFVAPWASCTIGLLAGLTYLGNRHLLVLLGVDDPLESSAIHAGSGMVGCLLLGLFARPAYVSALTGRHCGGLVYSGHHGGVQMGMQVLGLAVTVAWTGFWSLLVFWVLRRVRLLRVDLTTELAGIDNIEHGGPAYPEFQTSPSAGHT